MKNKRLNEVLTIGLLLLKLALQGRVVFAQFAVLGLGPLRDICDQLEMVLQLVFTLRLLGRLVVALELLSLVLFLRLRDVTVVFPCLFIVLLFDQLMQLLLIVFNVLIDRIVKFENCFFIPFSKVIREAFADSELFL